MNDDLLDADLRGRTALVTGANRGIGLEIARGLLRMGATVVLAARQAQARAAAVEALARDVGVEAGDPDGPDSRQLWGLALDVSDPGSIADAVHQLEFMSVGVDILVNNAGVYWPEEILTTDVSHMRASLDTHVVGPFLLAQALMPGMNELGFGRVVNLSSMLGQVTDTTPHTGAYGLSKAALNVLTRQLAAEAAPGVLVNAMCPGWVATNMGGLNAPRTPTQGADTALWLIAADDNGPNGGFFQSRSPIDW